MARHNPPNHGQQDDNGHPNNPGDKAAPQGDSGLANPGPGDNANPANNANPAGNHPPGAAANPHSPANGDAAETPLEQALRTHLAAEAAAGPPPDLWPRLASRLGEPPPPRRFSWRPGVSGGGGRRPPVWALASVAALAVVVAAALLWALAVGSDGNGGNGDDLIARQSAPAAETPAANPGENADGNPGGNPAGNADGGGATGPAGERLGEPAIPAAGTPPEESAPTLAPAPTPARQPATPTAVPAAAPQSTMVMVEERIVEVEIPSGADGMAHSGPASPAATVAPYPTPAPDGGAGELPPADTFFRGYGRQPFIATADDAESTFSLDADRTSYFLALSWARNGYTVDPDSVRAEEWLNAFDYGYAPPRNPGEFAITFEAAQHPLDAGRHLARLSFQAPEVADDRPLNVTLALDASGSMQEGDRVGIARAAAEALRQSLRPQDRLAVVHFSETVLHEFTRPHQPPGGAAVQQSIAALQPHGSTNVQAGLNRAVILADAARRQRPAARNYIILLSDGVANVDATDPFAILETAYDGDAANPLRLIAVGVGLGNYNDYLLEQLAQHGNGWYRYLNDAAQAQALFSRESWLPLSAPFADQVRARVVWDPRYVAAWRIIGYENRQAPAEAFTQDRREFAELPSGAATTVFYELELLPPALNPTAPPALSAPAPPLGQVSLRWLHPETRAIRLQHAPLEANANRPIATLSPQFRLGALVALTADRYRALKQLPPTSSNGSETANGDGELSPYQSLNILQAWLGELQPTPIGQLTAYHDFAFLLAHLTAAAQHHQPPTPTPPTGYRP